MTPEELEHLIQSALAYDYVRFTFAGINGISRGEVVPRRNVTQFLKNGIGIYAGILSSGPRSELVLLDEIKALKGGNGLLMPECTTLHPVPWAGNSKYKVGQVLCEMHWMDGTYQQVCPRTVARNQLQKLWDHGFALKSAFEMEFVLEQAHSGEPVWDGVDAYNHLVLTQQEEILFQIDQQLLESGVSIEKFRPEHAPGQYEMSLVPEKGIKAIDSAFIFKHGIKEIVQQKGMLANFMTIPRFNHLGNSTHFNHSLWTTDMTRSVFFDSTKDNNLSDIASWWLGGLCKHAAAVTALCAPTVNCYRRFHRPMVPDKANWGIENRSCAFRLKNQSASGCLIENRIASGTSNPYLVMAAVVAAGLDGIVNQIPCPEEHDNEASKLPLTLQEAIEELQNDTTMTEALGPDFVRWFVEGKKQVDLKKLEKSDPNTNDPEMLAAEREMYSLYM